MTLLELWEKNFEKGLNQFKRSIHESLSPPFDIFWIDGNIRVKVDLGGFEKEEINVELIENVLFIEANRDSIENVMENKKKEITIISAQRPLKVKAEIILPFITKEGDEKPEISEKSVILENGVLSLDIINFPKKKKIKPI